MSTPASTASGSIFDDEWNSFGGVSPDEYGNLDDLPDLDEILGRPPESGDAVNGDNINPQLLTGAAAPGEHGELPRSPYHGGEGDNIVVGPVSKVDSFEPTSAASSPYLHPSIETFDNQAPPYIPSPLRNQLQIHRRSVSEPPTDMLAHYLHIPAMQGMHTIPEQPITFTRSGINLGTPKIHHGNRAGGAKKKHPHITEPYPSHKPERYHLRRAQTQPGRPGPTSVPVMMQPPPPQMLVQTFPVPSPVGGHAVTTRVCTPAPSPPQQIGSPLQIHPQLMVSPRPVERKMVTIRLTVEELKGMITEAVQAALSGVAVRKSVEEDGVANGIKGEES